MSEPEASYNLTTSLEMVAVELYGTNVHPQFVNPMTLEINGVVEADWTHSGSQIGVIESTFRYSNGLEIEASEQTLRFEHVPTADGFLSPETAIRYVNAFGEGNWGMVVVEFGGIWKLTSKPDDGDVQLRHRGEDILTDNGVVPSFHAGALYQYPEHTLQAEIRQLGTDQYEFRASVNRRVPKDVENGLQATISRWESDWQDACLIISRLIRATLIPGGD